MKLIRYGSKDNEHPGLIDSDGTRYDVSGFCRDYDKEFFEKDGLSALCEWFTNNKASCPQISDTERLAAPLARPGKLVCIGLNYSDHAKESGMELPSEPVVFFKATSAICGPYDNIIIPKGAQKVDWEVELAVVIGKRASYVSEAEALDHVAGYVLHNDVSEREFQLERGGQWVKGKSCDTFAPLGPFIATPDEIGDPHNLPLWLKVNGETVQDGNTETLIFNIPHLISYLSHFMTLEGGDIISTGTPKGVGLGFDPPRYLKAGDVIELGVDGLGSSRQELVSYESTLE
jgi:2-keto-4-pentenoate hydratase/2-oxohepta-3-ene-1,7-dioic acid hydratase in catechol pathway